MVEEKNFKTAEEVGRKYFPSRILERLEHRVCERLHIPLDATYEHASHSSLREEPVIGALGWSKQHSNYFAEEIILNEARKFFEVEGFSVESGEGLNFSNEDNKYFGIFQDRSDCYHLKICKGPSLVKSTTDS